MSFEETMERMMNLREERAVLFCSLIFVTVLWLRERHKNKAAKGEKQKEGE